MLRRSGAISFLLIFSMLLAGCLEASFILAPESRLPKVFEVSEGTSRSDFKVTIDSYSDNDDGYNVFNLRKKSSFFNLEKIKITNIKGPFRLKEQSADYPEGYPFYVVISINGVFDIIEHRQKDDIVYMVDDPAVWKELGVKYNN